MDGAAAHARDNFVGELSVAHLDGDGQPCVGGVHEVGVRVERVAAGRTIAEPVQQLVRLRAERTERVDDERRRLPRMAAVYFV